MLTAHALQQRQYEVLKCKHQYDQVLTPHNVNMTKYSSPQCQHEQPTINHQPPLTNSQPSPLTA